MSKKLYPNPENELIRLLYKETSETEREYLVPAIFQTPSLQREFDELLDLKEQLDELSAEELIGAPSLPAPSSACIANILRQAKLG